MVTIKTPKNVEKNKTNKYTEKNKRNGENKMGITNLNRRVKKVNKGITLIALVITIIVLLILAGVSVATLTGEGGILNKATKAKSQTSIKEGEEAIKFKIIEAQTENEGKVDLDYLLNFLEEDENIFLSDIDEAELIIEYGDHVYSIDDKIVVTYLGSKEEWKKNSCSITTDLTEGITIDNKRKRVQKGQSYQATLTVEDGIQVSKIEVKMGDETINIDTENKIINISQVTDNIVITAKKLVTIEVFDYMRKNNLTPQQFGFTPTWTNCHTTNFTNNDFSVGRSAGTGEFSGTITIGREALKTLDWQHLDSFLGKITLTVTSSGNGNWASR